MPNSTRPLSVSTIDNIKSKFSLNLLMVIAATFVGSAANYLFQVIMGRNLNVEQFGTFGALFAIFYIASIFSNSLQAGIAEVIARTKSSYDTNVALTTGLILIGQVALMATIITIGFAIFQNQIRHVLNIESTHITLMVALSVFFALTISAPTGMFQGLQHFAAFSLFAQVIPQTAKLILGTIMISSGDKLFGAIASIPISGAFALTLSLIWVSRLCIRYGVHSFSTIKLPIWATSSVLLAIMMMIPANADVLMVAHFFQPEDVGLYNAISVLGKIIIYMPLPFALVLLPLVAERKSSGGNPLQVLYIAIIGAAIALLAAQAIYWLLPIWLTKLVIGDQYVSIAPFLGPYGLVLTIFATNMLLAYFHIGMGKRGFLIAASIMSLIEIISMIVFHNSFYEIMLALGIGNSILLAYGISDLFLNRNTYIGREHTSSKYS